MKAIVQERFGPPDVLQFADVDRPEAGPGEVLIRVHAASLNPADWHILRGDPKVARVMGEVGVRRPKQRVPGADAAGTVEQVGTGVTGVRPGEDVIGLVPGAFAEFARVNAGKVVPKPARLTFEQAAALPMAGQTALRGIRDAGQVRAGLRVLVNGAAGGVGSFGVQIAAALGAEVTGVCSTRNVDLVASLGAAHVVDYTGEDFTAGDPRYDVIFDNIGNRRLSSLRRALAATGTLVYNSGGPPSGKVFGPIASIARVALANTLTRQRLRPLGSTWKRQDLLDLTELVDAGTVTPVIDRTYPLADAAAGLRYLETGHARGKVVLTVP